jgi:tetratricopeptide (TPR) repeat protein
MRRVPFFAIVYASAALLLALSSSARAESLDRLFVGANQAFFRGDFEEAADAYERLEQAGVRDADVSFNLATAYARQGQLGRAVLGFSRALWLRPGDEGAMEGLHAAQDELAKRRADRIGEAELQTRPPLGEALVRPISADGLAIAMLLLCVALFGCLAALTRIDRSGPKLALTVAAPLCFLALAVLSAGLLVKLDVLRDGEPVIVLREGAPLREGPDDKALVRKEALEGQAARVLRTEGSHSETVLDTGARGWMNSKDLGRLRPD